MRAEKGLKLAEALLERSNTQKDSGALLARIEANALVQEGVEPGEDPKALIPLYEQKKARLLWLVQRINATNAATKFSETETIADAIARRDNLSERIGGYRAMYGATEAPSRRTAAEIRLVRCLDPVELQKTVDKLSKEFRELDTRLQSLNWTTDLIED